MDILCYIIIMYAIVLMFNCFIPLAESEDYKKSQNTFFFSDLTHSQFVLCSSIDIVDDSVAEPREDFHVTLSSSSDRTFINGASSHTVLINDDDGI